MQSGLGGGPEARETVYIFNVYKGRHNTNFSACQQTCQVFKERFPNEKRYVLRTANPEEPFFRHVHSRIEVPTHTRLKLRIVYGCNFQCGLPHFDMHMRRTDSATCIAGCSHQPYRVAGIYNVSRPLWNFSGVLALAFRIL